MPKVKMYALDSTYFRSKKAGEFMYCKKCGAQINDGSAFCQKCGTKQSIITASRETKEYSEEKEIIAQEEQESPYVEDGSTIVISKESQGDTKKAKNKKLKIAFIIVFIAFIVTTEILCFYTQGLKNNILITLASCVLPAAVGIGFNSLGNAFKNRNGMQRFLHIFGSVFHCLCPIILMFTFYYTFHNITRSAAIILALSLSFFGYIPAHYNRNDSLMENNILGVINLFSAIFMWSFVISYLGNVEALRYALSVAQSSWQFEGFGPLLFKVGIVLMLIQALKLIAEEIEYNTCKEKD